jgi:REP element-mobilizing transposase RayT
MPDHVHLLVSLSKNRPLSELLMEVKRGSSKWIKTQDPSLGSFAWQDGYAGFSIGESGVSQLTTYIHNQKKHHETHTFKEELIEFLRKHGVDYDERYIWS